MPRKKKPDALRKSAGLHVRLTEQQLILVRLAAATTGKEMSEWARDILIDALPSVVKKSADGSK